MKKLNNYKLLLILTFMMIALLASFCTTRESQVDSKQVAEEKNKEKFTSKEAEKDAQIVTDAVAESLAQLRLADIALQKSRDEEVKRIAEEIKDNHSKLLAELTSYAAEKVITVPLTESNEGRKAIQKIEDNPDQFNKNWCEEVRSMHRESIATLEKGQKSVSDPKLKTWIDTALPKIRRNLDQISACHNRLK
jgi:putative membrane protein